MQHHLEIEYKTLLTLEDYRRLLPLFDDTVAIRQTNHYLETANADIKRAKMSLRIRTFSNKAELTLKIPKKVGNEEYNQTLTLTQAQQVLDQLKLPEGQILDLLMAHHVPLDQLKVLGSLTTTRLEKAFPIGLMALDDNTYSGKQDYELELEVEDAKKGKEDFNRFLAQHGISFTYAKSKVARFVETLHS